MKVIIRSGMKFRDSEILLEVEVSDSAYAGRLDDLKRSFNHHLNDMVKDFVAPWWETNTKKEG